MFLRFASLCLLFMTPIVAWSADSPAPPTQQVLRKDSSGQWQIVMQVMVCRIETQMRTYTKKVPETVTVQEVVNGKTVTKAVTQYREVQEAVPVTVCIPDYQTIARNVDQKSIQAFETDGRKIPIETLSGRINGETLVVISATDAMIPESYAKLFKPGSIVLTNHVLRTALATPSPNASVVPPTPSPVVASPAAKLPQLPKSPAPLIVTVSREGSDKVNVRRLMEATSPVTGTQIIKKGAVKQTAPVEMKQTMRMSETFSMNGIHLRLSFGESKGAPFDKMKEKLSREVTAIYSADGDDIDPFWLRNLKSTTLIVTGPQLPSGFGQSAPAFAPVTVPSPAPPPPLAAPVPASPAPVPK